MKKKIDERKKQIRSALLSIRLNEEERKILNNFFCKTTANSLSEYARSVLLKEPVTVRYRNQSADDFLSGMLQLKKELNAIGNNFNQLVHRLHTLDRIPEIKVWSILNESTRKAFFKKVEEIEGRMSQIYELLLQK